MDDRPSKPRIEIKEKKLKSFKVIYMTKQKKQWIIDYIQKSPNQVIDAFDKKFVDTYIETFGASFIFSNTGIKRSSYLLRIMADMCEEGILTRQVVGLSGMPNKYPRWTYEYRVAG